MTQQLGAATPAPAAVTKLWCITSVCRGRSQMRTNTQIIAPCDTHGSIYQEGKRNDVSKIITACREVSCSKALPPSAVLTSVTSHTSPKTTGSTKYEQNQHQLPKRYLRVVQTGSGVHPPLQWVPGREADHSPPASAEVKKMWIYTSTPTYAFMA
jgi:hypothetical protein